MYTPCAGLCIQLFTAISHREIIIPQGIVQSDVLSCFQLFDTAHRIFVLNQAATAYFPLVLLISGSIASSTCKKLKRKIGSKVRPGLTASSNWSFDVFDSGNALIAPNVGLSTC